VRGRALDWAPARRAARDSGMPHGDWWERRWGGR